MTRLKTFVSIYFTTIVRFWTNQLVMSIMGISIGLATIALGNTAVSVIGCVFSILLLCFLQYDNMFQLGERHHFKHVDSVRPGCALGFKIAILASFPMLLLILVGIFFQVVLQNATAVTVCKLIYYFLHGSYIQTHAFVASIGFFGEGTAVAACIEWMFYILYLFPAILAASIGYILGFHDRPLQTFFRVKHHSK